MSDAGDDKLTPKQEAFVQAYLQLGNASQAYREVYACTNMAAATINREASALLANPKITTRLTRLRDQAASKAALSKAWVLERLMRNARIALGEEKVTLTVRPRGKEGEDATTVTVEVTARDANAANKALELLARHLGLFEEDNAQTGKAAGEALGKELSDIEFARWLAFKLTNGAKQAEAEAGGADVLH